MIAKNSTANLGKSSLMLVKKSCLNFRLASNVNRFGESYTCTGYINKKRAVVPLKKTYLDERMNKAWISPHPSPLPRELPCTHKCA
jgi:hypothetical protein